MSTATVTGFLADGVLKLVSAVDPLPITGSITASNPSVGTNGVAVPGSSTVFGWSDGSGNLQPVSAANPLPISGTILANADAQATTAAPSYINGTANPLSQNLTGDLRTIAKQSGAWTVGIDQTTPGLTNAVDVTNWPVTVAVGTGVQNASSPRLTVAIDAATVAGSAPGTAGTAAPTVLSVQGIAGMTAVAVSAASLPLPAGAATAANQATEIASLAAIQASDSVMAVAPSVDQGSVIECLNTIVLLLQEINFRLREQPINLATALNQTLNLSAGPLVYANQDSSESFAFGSSNRLNN